MSVSLEEMNFTEPILQPLVVRLQPVLELSDDDFFSLARREDAV